MTRRFLQTVGTTVILVSFVGLSGCAGTIGDQSVLHKRTQSQSYQAATAICTTIRRVQNNSDTAQFVRFNFVGDVRPRKPEASGWLQPGESKDFGVRTFANGDMYMSVQKNGRPVDSVVLKDDCPPNNYVGNPKVVSYIYDDDGYFSRGGFRLGR